MSDLTAPLAVSSNVAGMPRILVLLAGVGLLLALNRYEPEILRAVLVLVVLYVAFTHVPRVVALVGTVPSGLGAAFRPGH